MPVQEAVGVDDTPIDTPRRSVAIFDIDCPETFDRVPQFLEHEGTRFGPWARTHGELLGLQQSFDIRFQAAHCLPLRRRSGKNTRKPGLTSKDAVLLQIEFRIFQVRERPRPSYRYN